MAIGGETMRFNYKISYGLTGLLLGILLLGAGKGVSQTKEKDLKKVAVTPSEPSSGKQMFKDYCAVCHGADAKGAGPATEYLKVPPPDLTTMAKRYNEKSITLRVDTVLRFGANSKAHGTADMPIWGGLFSSLDRNQQAVAMRIANLSQYIQSLQRN